MSRLSPNSNLRVASPPTPGFRQSWWAGRRPPLSLVGANPDRMLLVVVGLFVVVHLTRLSLVLVNADSGDYLWAAFRVAQGEFPRHRYSPGLAYLFAPLVGLTRTNFSLMYAAAGLFNLGIAIAALLFLHRFLVRHLPAWTALALVAVFALGQSVTNAMHAAEVEPLVLLLVSATLVLMGRDRPWPALGTTALCAVSRVAVLPFFGVLWMLRVRRDRRPAVVALLAVGAAGVGYMLAPKGPGGGYVDIASNALGIEQGGGAFVSQTAGIAFDAAVRYCRLGLPAMVWPAVLLNSVPGSVLGFLTTAIIAVGAWRVLRQHGGDRLPSHAVIAAAAYLGLLLLWPAYDEKVIRLVLPVAPVVLLALATGLGAVLEVVQARWRRPAVTVVLACALAGAVLPTAALVATRRRSPPPLREFITANQRARDLLGPGAVLSSFPEYTEIITGRPGRRYLQGSGPDDMLREAARTGACAAVIDRVRGDSTSLRQWVTQTDAPVIASAGASMVIRLEGPSCPAPR